MIDTLKSMIIILEHQFRTNSYTIEWSRRGTSVTTPPKGRDLMMKYYN